MVLDVDKTEKSPLFPTKILAGFFYANFINISNSLQENPAHYTLYGDNKKAPIRQDKCLSVFLPFPKKYNTIFIHFTLKVKVI